MKLGLAPRVAAIGIVLGACAPPRFTYAPVATTSADLAGMTAASYSIPSDAPAGDVHVAALGIADVRRHPRSPWTEKAIRVSLVVSNRSSETWRVEGKDQHVDLGPSRVRVVLDARSDDEGREILVDVPPSSTRWVDLVFLVPTSTDQSQLGAFDVSWSVRVGPGARATHVTRFARMLAPPAHKGVERAPDPYAPMDPTPSTDLPVPGTTPPYHRPPPQ